METLVYLVYQLFPLLAHLSQRLGVSYCHQPMSVVRRVSSTITSNDISSETASPRTLIFGM